MYKDSIEEFFCDMYEAQAEEAKIRQEMRVPKPEATPEEIQEVRQLQGAASVYRGCVPYEVQYGHNGADSYALTDYSEIAEKQFTANCGFDTYGAYMPSELREAVGKAQREHDRLLRERQRQATALKETQTATDKVTEVPEPKKALRYNDSKVPMNLNPVDAETEEALVWMCGFRKYPTIGKHPDGRTIQNWEALWGEDTLDVVLGCAMRHLAELRKGNFWEVQKDKEGNVMRWPDGRPIVTHHAASVRTNMAMVIRYLEQNFAEAKAKFIEGIEE